MSWFSRFLAAVAFMLALSCGLVVYGATPNLADASEAPVTSESDLTYSPQWPEPPDTGAMLLRLGMGTAAVLVLCVGSLWFGKPWLLKLQASQNVGTPLQIEGSVTLGQRAVLYLVKVGDTQLVAGTDASGLKSLIALPASFKDDLDEQLTAANTGLQSSLQQSGVAPTAFVTSRG